MKTALKENERLLALQGKSLQEIEAKDILPTVVYSGREDDYENAHISFRLDDDRLNTIFSVNYYEDPDTREEYAIIAIDNKTFEIPATKYNDLNFSEFDNRLNQIKKEYGDVNVYIDNKFLQEQEHIQSEPVAETTSTEIEQDNETDVFDPEPANSLAKNHARTKLEETEVPVDIRDIANKLEEKGYILHVKQGGHLLVQDPNLAPQNSITVTKKNAYIEDVNLQSHSAIGLYNEMKENVLGAIDESFTETKEKNEIINNYTKVADVSVLFVTQDLLRTHIDMDNQHDFKDVMSGSKAEYQFFDEKGNDYVFISLDYTVNKDKEKTVDPVLNVRYGKEYGKTEISFEISQEDIDALKNSTFYKAELAQKINTLTSIGDKDREFAYANMKSWKVKGLLDKNISKEFSFLNANKIEYFTNVALEYYSQKRDTTLAEFELKKLKDAPFYRSGMSSQNIHDTLAKAFNDIEKKVNVTNFDNLIKNAINHQSFSYKKFEDGELAFDSTEKEPINYDREWMNKLAKLEDSILDLRYGPIQDAMDIAKSVRRGTKEFVEGIAEFKSDGVYSGFDVGGGLTSFRDGWAYGDIVSSLEREYRKLTQSDNDFDRIAAIDKKMDLKLLRDDIRDNANVYTKAAISLHVNADKMLDIIKSLRTEKAENTLTESRFKGLKKQFIEYSKKFVEAYNSLKASIEKMNTNIKSFGANTKGHGLDAIAYTEAKSNIVLNNVKDNFNSISKNAQILLNMKEFNKERIAEKLNDIRVEKTFGSLSYTQFNAQAKTRFWSELDSAIQAGEDARRMPETERTAEDNQTIRFGNQMNYQKEQGLFVAESIRNEIKHCVTEKVPYNQAVERLAQTYNNEAMTFKLRNSESSVKNYHELSDNEKEMCKDLMKDLLKTMPKAEATLTSNEITKTTQEKVTDKLQVQESNNHSNIIKSAKQEETTVIFAAR